MQLFVRGSRKILVARCFVARCFVAICLALALPSAASAQGAVAALMFKPNHAFSTDHSPAAPDYKSRAAWAALPDDGRIEISQADGPKPQVNVFFLHPTTFLNKAGWNAAFGDPGNGAGGLGVDGTLRGQASAFARCCRIFAPRYRQATLYAFLDSGTDGMRAIDLAYQDVRAAFDDFIARRNEGKPFILAGHSQGSIHLLRLLQERIAGTPLEKQMVAAYVVGAAVPRDFNAVPVCADAVQRGCMVSWNAVAEPNSDRSRGGTVPIWLEGRYQRIGARPLMCVNPLDWRIDGSADARANLGVLSRSPGDSKPALKAGYAAAKCVGGELVVDLPKDRTDFQLRLGTGASLHTFDYSLFYENLRVNAQARAEAFLSRR